MTKLNESIFLVAASGGASSMLVVSERAVKQHGLKPMGRIVGYAQAAVDPKIMGIGPVPATGRLVQDTNGGAISLGHPIGCTGARITTTLVHALHARKKNLGLATLYISGGWASP